MSNPKQLSQLNHRDMAILIFFVTSRRAAEIAYSRSWMNLIPVRIFYVALALHGGIYSNCTILNHLPQPNLGFYNH